MPKVQNSFCREKGSNFKFLRLKEIFFMTKDFRALIEKWKKILFS